MFLDIKRHRAARYFTCAVDGVDVTGRCFAVNDVEGWADCYVYEDGRPKPNATRDRVETERLTGVVVLTPVENRSEHRA